MMWAISLLGIGKRIMGFVQSGIAWIFSDIHRVIIAALIVVCVVFWIGWGNAADTSETRRVALVAAKQTIKDMEAASKAATKASIANSERVKAEYERINDEAEKDYAAGLAANRATIERWKLQNGRDSTGQTDSATTAEVSSGITDAETLPFIPRGFVLLPESDLDKTAVIQANLFALQEAARKAMAVETAPVE